MKHLELIGQIIKTIKMSQTGNIFVKIMRNVGNFKDNEIINIKPKEM
jgi:hypothetical protein